MTFGQVVIKSTIDLFLGHVFLFVWIAIIGFIGLDFYNKYVKINKDTDKTDMVQRYVYLQRRKK